MSIDCEDPLSVVLEADYQSALAAEPVALPDFPGRRTGDVATEFRPPAHYPSACDAHECEQPAARAAEPAPYAQWAPIRMQGARQTIDRPSAPYFLQQDNVGGELADLRARPLDAAAGVL